jgi:hypothetical protein
MVFQIYYGYDYYSFLSLYDVASVLARLMHSTPLGDAHGLSCQSTAESFFASKASVSSSFVLLAPDVLPPSRHLQMTTGHGG